MWRGRGKRRKQQLDRSLLLYRFLGQQLLDIRGGGVFTKDEKPQTKSPKLKVKFEKLLISRCVWKKCAMKNL
jgi:hypothetical protein